jgi:hypothetical protein
MQLADVLPSADDRQALAFERVAHPGNDDRFRKVVERGSLSGFPSTTSTMNGS